MNPVSLPLQISPKIEGPPTTLPVKLDVHSASEAEVAAPVAVRLAVTNTTSDVQVPLAVAVTTAPPKQVDLPIGLVVAPPPAAHRVNIPLKLDLSANANEVQVLPVSVALTVTNTNIPANLQLPVELKPTATNALEVPVAVHLDTSSIAKVIIPTGFAAPPLDPRRGGNPDSSGLLWILAGIILLSGLLGGIIRHTASGTPIPPGGTTAWTRWIRPSLNAILWGVLAASLLPAALQLTGSEIMDKVDGSASSKVVLFGLCLLAAVIGAEFCSWALNVFRTAIIGQKGAKAPSAQDLWGIDMGDLAKELSDMANMLRRETSKLEEANRTAETQALQRAAVAAEARNHESVFTLLGQAGPWGLEQAIKNDKPTAAEALRRVLGSVLASKKRPIGEGKPSGPSPNLAKTNAPMALDTQQVVPQANDKRSGSFEDLVTAEATGFGPDRTNEAASGRPEGQKRRYVSTLGPGGVPWVRFRSDDRVGLALSGGGIRSSTFALGLLYGLRDKCLLPCVDYLSTVSGGGYLGGWWTAWLARKNRCDPIPPAPPVSPGIPRDFREAPEVRHLREFSNFLVPRIGLFRAETWNAVATVLGNAVITFAFALSILAGLVAVWALLAQHLMDWQLRELQSAEGWLSALLALWPAFAVMAIALIGGHLYLECHAGRRQSASTGTEEKSGALLWLVQGLCVALVSVGAWAVCFLWLIGRWPPGWSGEVPLLPESARMVYAFSPAIALLATALFFHMCRGVVWRCLYCRSESMNGQSRCDRTLGRIVSRCVAAGLIWAGLMGLWQLAGQLSSAEALVLPGGTALTAAGVFAAIRNWLFTGKSALPTTVTEKIMAVLKPRLPAVLAYLALGGLTLLLMALAHKWAPDPVVNLVPWMVAVVGFVIVILIGLFLYVPERMGLHDFYRARICRAYLGASNPKAVDSNPGTENAGWGPATANRDTDEQPKDDLSMNDAPERPLHLVCCAANDLAGDRLPTISRGACSATLSRHGIALGDYFADSGGLKLSSALTASAAAFNPNMGSRSVALGLPVAFLLGALNLRLGLWVPHPAGKEEPGWMRRFPGLLFLRELVMGTRCPLPERTTTKNGESEAQGPRSMIHLSDGAHFENLGLYELIRRHCRYIVVSDAGQDPHLNFDDFGNAARRVREDFGVEIEIDLRPLKPGPDGNAKQHLAVGTIHYDGIPGADKGILLYFKPTLTGDEPVDVRQYRQRNPQFPHESTGDQFFDEAQWEAYRRLGEHAAHDGLRFMDRDKTGDNKCDPNKKAQDIFTEAREHWYPTPPDFHKDFQAMSDRCMKLEQLLREKAPLQLRNEIFPEVRTAFGSTSEPQISTAGDEINILSFVLQMGEATEQVWIGCQLETHWEHPLNRGWVSYLQRWTRAESFRRWWPVLRPLYSPAFVRFAESTFDLRSLPKPDALVDARWDPTSSKVEGINPGDLPPWASQKQSQAERSAAAQSTHLFRLKVTLTDLVSPVLIGVAYVNVNGTTVTWSPGDLILAPAYWDMGLRKFFLDQFLKHFEKGRHSGNGEDSPPKCSTFIVNLKPDPKTSQTESPVGSASEERRTDIGYRLRREDTINFYKAAGFNLVDPNTLQRSATGL